jgi:hypothetical protein
VPIPARESADSCRHYRTTKNTSSTALAITAENTALAIAAAAQEEGANELGRLLKFSNGHYVVGTEEIPLGKEFVAHVEHWIRGWLKFKGGALIERKVGRVADGFVVPQRDELGDTDESLWDKDPAGKPTDPWTMQSYLPLEDVESGEIWTFVSGSVGGRQAVSRLAARAARHLATQGLPRVDSQSKATNTNSSAASISRTSALSAGQIPARSQKSFSSSLRRITTSSLMMCLSEEKRKRRVLFGARRSSEDLSCHLIIKHYKH